MKKGECERGSDSGRSRLDSGDPIDARTRRFLKYKARQLTSHPGFGVSDREDIVQELTLRLLQRSERFDPRLGPRRTFARVVIERQCASLVKQRLASARGMLRPFVSLDGSTAGNGESRVDLYATISDQRRKAHRQGAPRSDEEVAQLSSDVAMVLSNLPARDRELCELLKRNSVATIARQTGIPRTTLQARVRRLRAAFEDAGMRDYFQTPSSSRDAKRYLYGRGISVQEESHE